MNPIYWKTINKENLIASIYWLIILAVCFLLVSHAAFGMLDDHHFIESILSGKNLKLFIVPESGRFYPLVGQEYNLISFFSKDPAWFYLFSALELILMAWLLVQIGKLAINGSSAYLPYGAALLTIFSPGFLLAWTRLLTPERNNLFLFAIFIFNYLLFKQSYKYRHFIIGVLAATVALFYKETSFIFIGTIGIIGLIFDSSSRKDKILYSALCLISVAWIIIYITFFIWAHPSNLYGQTQVSYFKSIPACLGFFTLSDPLIIVSMSSIIYSNVSKFRQEIKLKTEDILLVSGLIYISVYLVLKLYGYHYLLPITCVVPYILLKHFQSVDLKTHKSKFLIAVFFIIYITFTLPTAINIFYSNKVIAYNLELTRQKIVEMSKDWNGANTISLVGLNEYRTDEILYSFKKYIKHDTNLPIGVNSEIENYKSSNCKYFADAFSQSCDNPVTYFRKGDILLLTPYDSVDIASHLEGSKDYSLVYRTGSSNLAVPGLKDFLKYLIVKYNIDFGTSKIIKGTHDKFNFYVYVRN